MVENVGEGNDMFTTAITTRFGAIWNIWSSRRRHLQGFGNGPDNAIFGNAGNNIIDGGAGADFMSGGAGNDIYFVDNAGDVVESASEGNDAVFASVNYGLTANVETLVLQGSADLQGFGNGLANTIFGNAGNNLIDGGAGADTMIGGAGNDLYFVDNPGDVVVENAEPGQRRRLRLRQLRADGERGSAGAAGLRRPGRHRQRLANAIFGNSGNNTLDGGAGNDSLTGNAGNDTFVFNFGQANGDTVVDFAGNGAAAGICSISSATAPVPASPTSTPRTGRSTTTAAHSTTSSPSATPRTIDASDFLFL